MKEYIIKFASALLADGYIINDIPFTSTVVKESNLTNLTCNQENKKIVVDGDNISIVDAGPVTPPNDEIWYTSSDGNIVAPYRTSGWPEFTNTYENGKGVIKFKTDVTSIVTSAFYYRTSLTSVTIPNSITSIGDGAFAGCTGLTSPVYNTHIFAYMPDSYSGAYTIPDGIESIARYAFLNCNSLTSVMIGNSVTSIEYGVFMGCSSLTSVTIPNSVTSIGGGVFAYCSGLTSVTIPNSVTSIGESAFSRCTSLTSVTIPNSVTSIGRYAFENVPNIVYSGSATGSPWRAKSVNGYIDGYFVYSDASKTTLLACSAIATGEIVIPNSVTSIEDNAFAYCSGLTSVTIPNSVTSIEYGAFALCSGLTSVIIPNSVTSIGNWAFTECTNLEYITIPNSITNIQTNFLYMGESYDGYPGSLKTITVGETVYTYNGDTIYEIVLNGKSVWLYMWAEISECCFVQGTQIQLADNTTKNIEDIEIGDSIISYNPTTDELYTTTVAHTITHENTTTLARVTLANGSIVKMNEYHPILTKDGWHSITNYKGYDTLIIGDEVKTLDGYSEIVNIERWINEPITTYNLDVVDVLGRDREYDNYFANGICAHNPQDPC